MSDVSASMVKSLRDRTGAGMMACRDALRETAGDEEKAIEIIQKKGLSKVACDGARLLGDLAEALLLNDLDRFFFVARRLTKRVPARHHAGARAIAE